MAHSPGLPYPSPSGEDGPDPQRTDAAALPLSDLPTALPTGLPDGADVWQPPDHPACRSDLSAPADWPDGIPPGPLGHRNWWREAVSRAVAAHRQPPATNDDPLWFTPTPEPAPAAFGTLLCALCTDGIWRPELVRLTRTDVFLGIVNGAPMRLERRLRIPCCETCWNRLNFVRMEVERGRLSDWPGGVFHHFKAVMPPVYDMDDLLRHHRDDEDAVYGDGATSGPDGAWGWRT